MYDKMTADIIKLANGKFNLRIDNAPSSWYEDFVRTRDRVDWLAENRPDLYSKITRDIQKLSDLYAPPSRIETNDYD